jgi:hypothetical protein
MPRHGWVLLVLLTTCLLAAKPAQASAACTINWSNDAGGSWETAANWSENRLPNGNDDVCIDRGAANPAITLPTTVSARSIANAETLKLTSLQLNQKLTNTGTIELTERSPALEFERAGLRVERAVGGVEALAAGVLADRARPRADLLQRAVLLEAARAGDVPTGKLTLGNGASVHSNFTNPGTVRQTGLVTTQ